MTFFKVWLWLYH